MSLLSQVHGLLTGLTNLYPPEEDHQVSIQLHATNPGGLQFSFWDSRGELVIRLEPEELEEDLETLLEGVVELLEREVDGT